MSQTARISELRAFFKDLQFGDPLANPNILSLYKPLERDLYALLLWGLALDLYRERNYSEDELHLKEAIADIASANFCTLCGLHKLSMTALRSGVENFVKAALSFRGVAINDTKSLYELNDRFRDLFSTDDRHVKKEAAYLRSAYVRLCKYVHSSSANFMDLRISYATLIEVNDDKMIENVKNIQGVCKAASGVLFRLHSLPPSLHHKQRDYILDRLPGALKRAVMLADMP